MTNNFNFPKNLVTALFLLCLLINCPLLVQASLVQQNTEILNKPKIIVSITPLAAIIKMLVDDEGDVMILNSKQGCPHHYHMRPSDRQKILNSDIIIYIDDGFDGYFKNILKSYNGKIIKISGLNLDNIFKVNGKTNWHFWLELDAVQLILSKIKNILIKEYNRSNHLKITNTKFDPLKLEDNYLKTAQLIADLKQQKTSAINRIEKAIVLSDSLEHFFKSSQNIIYNTKSTKSLRAISDLESSIKKHNPTCLIIDNATNQKIYNKFILPIVALHSENWASKNSLIESNQYFPNEYIKLLKKLELCH
jgi:zinc transport system substrate-binding protein